MREKRALTTPLRPWRLAASALLLIGVAILAGCASGYKDFYRPNQGIDPRLVAGRRPATAPPLVERAQPGNDGELVDAYSRRGYILIGTSFFNSGRRETDASAVQQARSVGADLVVILDPRYTGSQTSSIPLTLPTATTTYVTGSATVYGPRGPVTAYGSGTATTYGTTTTYIPVTIHRSDYGALYFVKQRSSFEETEVSVARGGGGVSGPVTAPPGPPPPVGAGPADPPAASGAPDSPSPSAKGALEWGSVPSLPPIERYSWILGTWEAVEDKSGVVDGLARFEIWHDGGQLKWRMRRAGWLSGIHTKQEASGTVSRISDSTVELNGKYEITNLGRVGQAARHSLTRDGDRLRGYEFTNDGIQLPWFLRRIR
jgi:hypothetical protein